jgi:hypothetical protein
MLDVDAAEGYQPEEALDNHHAAAEQYSSDMQELDVVARRFVAYNLDAFLVYFVVAYQYGSVEVGGAVGWVLQESRQDLGHRHHSRHCQQVQGHLSMPVQC